MVGQTISHYRVLGQIGAGGMGVVYRGEDLRLGRAVALKFVSEDLAHDQHAVQRLRAEARAASALNHGNICTIYDIDEHDGHPFIVMELLKGRTLRDFLSDGPLKIHQLVDFGIQIADALHAAHSEGIIHRDIKPGNLFVTERGQVKILDFGLAKLKPLFDATGTTRDVRERTSRGVTLGTTGYMSPEQATGEELDPRTDLFSLGVVLYECATGRHPFPGKSSAVVLSAILNRSPTPPSALNPDLPVRVQEVIHNCLEKDRELRYQSAADLRADLKRVRRDIESGHSEAIEPVRSGASKTSRSASGAEAVAPTGRIAPRWQAAAAIAAIALVVGAGAYVVWQQREQVPPLERQRVEPAPDSSTPVLALATASLNAGNYRAAVSYAEQVLAVQPDNAGAIKIRDAARAALTRFDAAIADARKRLAAKDVRGATQALDVARGIDAASPAVIEVGSLIAEQTRQREPAARAMPSTRTPEEAPRTIARAPATPSASGKPQAAPQSDTPPPPKVDVPPPSVTPGPLPSPPVTATPPAPAQPPPAAVQQPPVPAQQPKASPTPSSTAAETPQRSAAPAGPSKEEEDHAAIRRLVATFTRAIENKDLALYRSIRPNLSREEERRLQDGFRAVTSQRVELRITAIDLRGDEATVTLRRRDTIRAGGQQQVSEEREQRMMLARTAGAWRIVDIR